jgi:hypothetical protein
MTQDLCDPVMESSALYRPPRPGPPWNVPANVWKGPTMARCEVCGNDYEQSFELHLAGQVHTFDSFECAIHRLAPTWPCAVEQFLDGERRPPP